MRVLALHPDVLVATSAIWQTNCVVVRATTDTHDGGPLGGTVDGGAHETFVVDSPVLPDELDALPTLLEQARFAAPSGLLATHGDWDHLLGPLAFPGVALGCAQSTAERLRATPGAAQRELRVFDEQYLIERPRPLALGAVQALPVPGRCGLGEPELELHPAEGHTEDGMAIWVPWARVLLAGDYLSSVEIPTVGVAATAPSTPGARWRPILRRWIGCGPWWKAPSTWCRATGRCSMPRGRSRCWRRISPISTRSSRAVPRLPCPRGGAPPSSEACTGRTSPVVARDHQQLTEDVVRQHHADDRHADDRTPAPPRAACRQRQQGAPQGQHRQ